MYKSEIIADSLSPQGDRLTTFIIQLPRIVLAELNTHRMFSRNSASSRAIPTSKMIRMVEENPFVPIAWQKKHRGMQGTKYFTERSDIMLEINEWFRDRDYAVDSAKRRLARGVSKQLCNRLLEPFMWHKVILTTSEEGLENFFKLRCPQYYDRIQENYKRSRKDISSHNEYGDYPKSYEDELAWLQINESQADIHIQKVSEMMWDSMNESKPKELEAGEWHIPFGDNITGENFKLLCDNNPYDNEEELQVQIATARCARLSYNNFVGKDDYAADIQLYQTLAKMEHWSPFEHCARAMSNLEYNSYFRGKNDIEPDYMAIAEQDIEYQRSCSGWCKNFRGFVQLREILEDSV
jgi:thymidylate synthase ThyX